MTQLSRTDEIMASYDHLLTEYASGALDDALRLIVAAHLSLSQTARRHVAFCEALGGVMLESQCDPVAMLGGSLSSVLQKLDECVAQPCAEKNALCCDVMGFAAPPAIAAQMKEAHQWMMVAPGIRITQLPAARPLALAAMKPGARIPEALRRHLEIALVLDGALKNRNNLFGKGALVVRETDDCFSEPAACAQAGSLCLFATSSPVPPPPRVTRFFYRFVRIRI